MVTYTKMLDIDNFLECLDHWCNETKNDAKQSDKLAKKTRQFNATNSYYLNLAKQIEKQAEMQRSKAATIRSMILLIEESFI